MFLSIALYVLEFVYNQWFMGKKSDKILQQIYQFIK